MTFANKTKNLGVLNNVVFIGEPAVVLIQAGSLIEAGAGLLLEEIRHVNPTLSYGVLVLQTTFSIFTDLPSLAPITSSAVHSPASSSITPSLSLRLKNL